MFNIKPQKKAFFAAVVLTFGILFYLNLYGVGVDENVVKADQIILPLSGGFIPMCMPIQYSVVDGNDVLLKGQTGSIIMQPSEAILDPAALTNDGKDNDVWAIVPESERAWHTIMTMGFEGAFPTGLWRVSGNPTWGKQNVWGVAQGGCQWGQWSAWCAKGGTAGLDPPGYMDNMNAWMVYGPFSLAGAADTKLSFYYYNSSEYLHDWFYIYQSVDGIHFYGYNFCGDDRFWYGVTWPLTNLCGDSTVWIAFRFTSNATESRYGGAFVDGIVLEKEVSVPTVITDFTSHITNLGLPILLHANLKRADNNAPIPGQTLTFKIFNGTSWISMPDDGISGTSFVTDANGYASVFYTPPPDWPTGIYPIAVEYRGIPAYNGSRETASLEVNRAQWTYLVYMDGDNKMEPFAEYDFYSEMVAMVTNSNINVAVLFDRSTGYSEGHDNWTTTRRFIIPHDGPPVYTDLGEQNMGDPNTLASFVTSMCSALPANNYALVLWGRAPCWQKADILQEHVTTSRVEVEQELVLPGEIDTFGLKNEPGGNGSFRNVCFDDTNGGDSLTMTDLSSALSAATGGGANKIQFLDFDANVMGLMEVAYQVSNYVSFMVSSEDLVPDDGNEYQHILGDITATTTAANLAAITVQRYQARYPSPPATKAAWYLPNLVSRVTSLNSFAKTLIANMASIRTQIGTAWTNTQKFSAYDGESASYIDLCDFAKRVRDAVNITDVQTAADALLASVCNATFKIAEYHASGYASNLNIKGLSIYFPLNASQPGYINYFNASFLAWAGAVQAWGSFLQAYFTPASQLTYFAINSGAASTTNWVVTLNNTATYNPMHYMACENTSFTGASWLTYSTAPSFTLNSGCGTKTVYFKVKNATGESGVLSDTIELSSPPVIGVLPSNLTFYAQLGGPNPPNRMLNINNTGCGTLNWSVSDNANSPNWLTCTPTSGSCTSETDQVTVSVNIAGLNQGQTGIITITATGASNTPQTVQVTLNIIASGFVLYPLKPGWNLMSFSVGKCFYQGDQPAGQPACVELVNVADLGFGSLSEWFSSVVTPDTAWKIVLGVDGAMDSSLSPIFHTLKYMSPADGYWVKIAEGSGGAVMYISGPLFDPGCAIPLEQDWNLVGYPLNVGYYDTPSPPSVSVPEGTIWIHVAEPVADYVFQSIAGKYYMVISDYGAYDPSLPPAFSSLHYFAPGCAYWIKMNAASSLIYPSYPGE